METTVPELNTDASKQKYLNYENAYF